MITIPLPNSPGRTIRPSAVLAMGRLGIPITITKPVDMLPGCFTSDFIVLIEGQNDTYEALCGPAKAMKEWTGMPAYLASKMLLKRMERVTG